MRMSYRRHPAGDFPARRRSRTGVLQLRLRAPEARHSLWQTQRPAGSPRHHPRAITPATIPSAATVAYAAPANLHEIVFPITDNENTLIIPNVQSIATTYGIGAPWVIAIYAIAASNAIGTGKNAPASATSTIPKMLACPTIACGGSISITSAPSTAPRIISGNAARNTYQKLFAYERATLTSACHQLSATGMSIGHTYIFSSSRDASAGANTKIKNSTVASFNTATFPGNNANVITSTT